MTGARRDEHGERPDPRSVLGDSVGFLLSKLGFLTSSRFAAALEPLGIGPGHFGLLRIVDAAGADSQQALGDALGIPPSRMVALVDDLEEQGLVERRRSPEDRRVNLVHLTAGGQRTLARALEAGEGWQEELLADLDGAEREQLLHLLQRVAASHDLPLGVHPALAEEVAPRED